MALVLLSVALAVISATPTDAETAKFVKRMARAIKPITSDGIQMEQATARGKTMVFNWKPAEGFDQNVIAARVARQRTKLICNIIPFREAMERQRMEIELNWTTAPGNQPNVTRFTAATCAANDINALRTINVPTQSTTAKRFEFRGIRTTDAAAMHLDQWGSLLKGQPACQDTGQMTARYGVPGTWCRFADGTVTGVRATLSAHFDIAGPLNYLSGLSDGQNFAVIFDAFVLKYGKPARAEAPEYKNALGQVRHFPMALWQFDDGQLTLSQDAKDGRKYARIQFQTNKDQAREKAWIDRLTPKPKLDF